MEYFGRIYECNHNIKNTVIGLIKKSVTKKKEFQLAQIRCMLIYAAVNCKKFTQKCSFFLKNVWKGEKKNKSRFKIGDTIIESINGIQKLRFEL